MRIAGWMGMAALAASLQAGTGGAVRGEAAAAPDVTIYVEHGDAVFGLLTKSLVVRMLAAAGVQVAWGAGQPKPDAAGGDAVSIRLAEASTPDCQRGVLARTFPFAVGVRRIIVFEDVVRARADASGIDRHKIMAHVLVHEIGHLLERMDRHSDTGVMKARWTLTDYQMMARQPLPFAQEDLELIHNALEELRVQRRLAAKKPD